MPTGDLVQHEPSEHCVCGPDSETVMTWGEVVVGVIYVHHSLDARERREQ
jgi:hypothetical protein